jgi:hypothetical protein
MQLNVYAAPAILTLILLVAETVFLMVALPETRGNKLGVQGSEKSGENPTEYQADANGGAAGRHVTKDDGATITVRPAEQRIKTLKALRAFHFLFLCIFSGVEFTLTFLTFDRT